MADDPENNPLMAVGHFFTRTLHHSSYSIVSPTSPSTNLTNASVVILGASRGIGRSLALSYARAGASPIALCARSTSALASVAEETKAAAVAAGRKEPRVVCVPVDVTAEESVKSAVEEIGRRFGQGEGVTEPKVDILLLNSGVLDFGTVGEMETEKWWRVWQVNVLGPFLASKHFMPLLLRSAASATAEGEKPRGGQIVVTSSVGAWLTSPGLSAYQTSKLAVLKLAEFVHEEYKSKGIVAFAVHPGNVLTDIVGGEDSDLPIKHLFVDKPELCADTVVFLTREKREWLGGRYISCTWDMEELMGREKEIVEGGKLKVTMQV